jgi:hypothetical protein
MPRADRQPSTVLRFAAIVAVCTLVGGPAPICRSADPAPDRGMRVPTGEFKIGKDGRLVLLPVTIGARAISCLVDTGACLSAFDVTLREFLGQSRGMRNLQTADRLIRVHTFDWPDARLDGQVLKSDQPAACLDLRHIREATNECVLGVIGIDLLRTVRLQIDFDEGTLRFLPSLPEARGELGLKIPLRFLRDGPPVIAGTPGPHGRHDFVIDTGAQGNSLEDALFDRLVEERHIRIGAAFSSMTATGTSRGQRGRLDRLSVGPLEHQRLRFSRLQYNSLGLRYFSRYVVTFDFPDACLYLRQGAHHARPEPGATSGLTLKWESAAPVVDAVRTDGPAARAGLARFDVLVGIDGKEAAEFDHFSLRELLTSEAGRRVKLRVRRGERELDFIVLLAED